MECFELIVAQQSPLNLIKKKIIIINKKKKNPWVFRGTARLGQNKIN